MTETSQRLLESLEASGEETRERITEGLRETAEENPEKLVGAIPLIEPHLNDPSEDVRENLLGVLGKVAKDYPEEVLPLSPVLKRRLDESVGEDGHDNAVGASFALGMVANEYPNVAEDSIPRFVELTKLDNKYVSNNAMALLADLANEYRDELVEYLPRCSEELGAEDNYMRYNALAVVARVAKEYPDEVEDEIGVDRIEEMLDADDDHPRENACWALMHLGERAIESVPRLERVGEVDDSERVRKVAKKAVYHIENRDKDWRV